SSQTRDSVAEGRLTEPHLSCSPAHMPLVDQRFKGKQKVEIDPTDIHEMNITHYAYPLHKWPSAVIYQQYVQTYRYSSPLPPPACGGSDCGSPCFRNTCPPGFQAMVGRFQFGRFSPDDRILAKIRAQRGG